MFYDILRCSYQICFSAFVLAAVFCFNRLNRFFQIPHSSVFHRRHIYYYMELVTVDSSLYDAINQMHLMQIL